ncbi:hypothetical protein [Sphingomonas sp. LT1P40]|uniref:hypothetical protein n=1 Tax=Alteristakelama amylovorans TaxID=3096166 RepID=UPI002FCBB0F9
MTLADMLQIANAVLLSITVILSLFATISAMRAAKSAEDTYHSAEARGRLELRPYLGASNLDVLVRKFADVEQYGISIALSNFGKTPAMNAKLVVDVYAFSYETLNLKHFQGFVYPLGNVLPSDQKPFQCFITGTEVMDYFGNSYSFLFRVTIQYANVNGERYDELSVYELEPTAETTLSVSAAHEGVKNALKDKNLIVSDSAMAKLVPDQVRHARTLIRSGISLGAVARHMKVRAATLAALIEKIGK